MPSIMTSAPQKKNKGGRPRKTASSHGKPGIQWKIITVPAGGLNHYEISSQGEVRRKLKSDRYAPVKPWVTGGPYAAVYLYGFRNATRNRKKCYIHRLVAEHFVSGRKKGEVVHHKRGPANNTAAALEWVSVEENQNARKYFLPDGTRKAKVKRRVPRPNAPKDKASPPAQSAQNAPIKKLPPKKLGKPAPPVQKLPEKKEHEPVKLPGKQEVLPDRDEYIPNVETLKQKIRWLTKNSKEFHRAYLDTKKVIKKLSISNLGLLFKQATGKKLKLDDDAGASKWKTKLISALHAIKTRLKT
jgi:hypothetical protein